MCRSGKYILDGRNGDPAMETAAICIMEFKTGSLAKVRGKKEDAGSISGKRGAADKPGLKGS